MSRTHGLDAIADRNSISMSRATAGLTGRSAVGGAHRGGGPADSSSARIRNNTQGRRKRRNRGRRKGPKAQQTSTTVAAETIAPASAAVDVSKPAATGQRTNEVPRLSKRLDDHMKGGRLADLDDKSLEALATELGYRKIGIEVPEDVKVGDIVRTFPKEVYNLDHGKAWRALATTFSSSALAWMFIAAAPWYLLPAAWFVAGTACTGLFVIGHECGHRIFHRNRLVNDMVGHLVMTPLIYPFEPWRIMHNLHHLHTNKLDKDTGWHPIPKQHEFKGNSAMEIALRAVIGTPLKLWLSLYHWMLHHFRLELFLPHQTKRVYLSWGILLAFMGTVWPMLISSFGVFGWVKFWLMPWLGYHFWMSTFTLVHHTAPHIPFRSEEEWHAAKAKLGGTVHCDYPKWVELLCHDINFHVPHHLSARIPWYNLRMATESLRENWGQYMTECRLNWRMMRNFFTEIHLYEGQNYVAFDADGEEETFLVVQRRIYPDRM